MTEQEKAERLAKSAPPLRDGELEAINALFPTYIFRRSCTEEIWTCLLYTSDAADEYNTV